MKKLYGLLIGAFLGLVLWSAYSVFVLGNADIYAENELIENTQAVLLVIACLVFLAPTVFEKRSDKLILLFCALLCYAFVLREVDVQHLNVPDALKRIGAGAGRNATIGAALLAILVYAGFNFSHYRNAAKDFLKSRPGVLLMTGGGFLILGDILEKYQSLSHHGYFEEISELGGFLLILLAAFAASNSLNGVAVRATGSANAGV